MYVTSVRIENFRNLREVSIVPGQGINCLYGANGAGKTSVLEALYLLGRGRSFRASSISPLIQDGASALRVVATCSKPDQRLGVERSASEWKGRIDQRSSSRISEFARAFPLVLVDPSNHELIEGPPAGRRSFLDWGLFHVEPSYLDDWKRFSRLLRQRNAALRSGADAATLDALEAPMARAAERVELMRAAYVEKLQRDVALLLDELRFRLDPVELDYRPSANDAVQYLERWRQSRARDLEHGFTREGPHRGELVVRCRQRLAAPRLSRGQMKLTALLLKLAQMQRALDSGTRPLLLLDDPVSELDEAHLESLLDWVSKQPFQTWITAVEPIPADPVTLFHVEHGVIHSGNQ
ncbi:MAG: DNA replication/repair protein RecF [Wenzhouxiangellaceae bacterium]|nr:DNA replication/repair protein RecF [Wenzhouxiangellaceae bacterium]